jgi:hypothetical protein
MGKDQDVYVSQGGNGDHSFHLIFHNDDSNGNPQEVCFAASPFSDLPDNSRFTVSKGSPVKKKLKDDAEGKPGQKKEYDYTFTSPHGSSHLHITGNSKVIID